MKVSPFQLSATALLFVAAALAFQSASGFSAVAPPVTTTHKQQQHHHARAATAATRLNAWSLPATNEFGTFSTSWFDVKDPTGRKVVYNDDAESSEWSYSFVASLGDDWPSVEDDDIITAMTQQQQEQQQPPQQSRRVRTWKRVAAWLRKNAGAASAKL